VERFDSAWSLRPEGLALVESLVAGGRINVVECGSGLSTVTIARALSAGGAGHVHALEHDPGWAATTREALDDHGLADLATVIDAPLVDGWYDRGALGHLPDRGIDLLLVDGPPAGDPGTERRRQAALPELADRLAPGAAIVLDDADRPGERWALDCWLAAFPLELRPSPPATALALYIPRGFEGSSPKKDSERKV
jgi:predicted O-methyltransferase YrrM